MTSYCLSCSQRMCRLLDCQYQSRYVLYSIWCGQNIKEHPTWKESFVSVSWSMSCWCVRGLKSGRRTARQGRFGGKGGKGSPTLLSHLNAESVPDPSLSTVDGSGSESVKSLRRRETHVHLNQRCIYTGPYLGTCIAFILERVSRTKGNSHLDCNEMRTGIMVCVRQIPNKPMQNCVNKRKQKLKTILKSLLVLKDIGLS